MGSSYYCEKCEKMLADSEFFTYKDGKKCELCKKCLTLKLDNYDEQTYLWILEKFDMPYLPSEWKSILNQAFTKDPYKINGLSVIGKYLGKMRLMKWKDYGWADSKMLQEREEEVKREKEAHDAESQARIKEAYLNGEITESQYYTYLKVNSMEEARDNLPERAGAGIAGSEDDADLFMEPAPEYAQVDLPDLGADLTEEDKVYLALKWGRLYTPMQWIWLEQKYNNFISSFDVQGEARVDTLVFICKNSLKMNEALDAGDIDAYQKIAKVYDAQMRAAKFTEAQNNEDKNLDFDAVGQIVDYCEKQLGGIPDYEILAPRDIIDEIIEDNHEYLRTLINNDPHIADQIEEYLKKLEIRDQMRATEGQDVTDADFAESFEETEKAKDLDKMTIKEALAEYGDSMNKGW